MSGTHNTHNTNGGNGGNRNQPPSQPGSFAQQPGDDPFAPEVVDEQIAALLTRADPRAQGGHDTRLVRSLATAYALPPTAQQTLARAYARLHAANVSSDEPESSLSIQKTSLDARPAGGAAGRGGQPPSGARRRGLWAGIAAAIVVALLVGLFARMLALRGPAAAPSPTLPTSGLIFDLSMNCPIGQKTCDIASQVPATEQILVRRANDWGGYRFTTATQTSPTTLQVKVPGATDLQSVGALLAMPGKLTILDTGGSEVAVGTHVTPGEYTVAFTSSQMDPSSLRARTDPNTGQPVLEFAFMGNAKAQFAQYTRTHVGDYLTIALDDTILESAVIQSEIDGTAQMTGIADTAYLNIVIAVLKSQPLPLSLAVLTSTRYGPNAPTPTQTTAAQATASATTQTSIAPGTGWTPQPGYSQLEAQGIIPSIAPTDADTAYVFALTSGGGCKACATNPPLLERTSDGGKTWQPMTMPSQLVGLDYTSGAVVALPVQVSPLDSHVIFVMVSDGTQRNCGLAAGNAGGCLDTFRSADAGQSWQLLSLPVPGGIQPAALDYPHVLRGVVGTNGAQRLYATANTQTPASGGGPIPTSRLIVSTDDGQTWQAVDTPLHAQGQGIDAYGVDGPASQGDSIYAITEAAAQNSVPYAPTYALWVSHAGGATWTQVALPNNTRNPADLIVAPEEGNGMVYLLPNGNGNSPAALYGSADGGVQWTPAPTVGLPSGAQEQGIYGTITNSMGSTDVLAGTSDGTFVAWNVMDPAWHVVAPPFAVINAQTSAFSLVISALNGKPVLLVGYSNAAAGGTTSVVQYTLGG